jgi:DNA-binding IclR family transcriptional regulator
VVLLVRACATTGRVWEPADKLAEELELPVSVVEDALHRLSGQDFLEEHPTLMRQLRCVELGPVFLRAFDVPTNLPVDPRPL